MRYIKYGFSAFRRQLSTNILIIIELAFLITALNIVIGSLNTRDMLYSPYAEVFKNEGYLFDHQYNFMTHDPETGKYIQSEEELLEETLSQLEGDFDAYPFFTYSFKANAGSDVTVIFADDRIFEGFDFPTESGRWKMPSDGKGYCVVTGNSEGWKPGSVISLDGVARLTVSGVLTDETYIPIYPYEYTPDVTDLYESFSYDMSNRVYVIAPRSAVSSEEWEILGADMFDRVILECTSDLTPEQTEHNEKILLETGSSDENMPAQFFDLKTIKTRSDTYLFEDFNKSIPIVICVWAIAIIGLVCSSAISTAKMLKSYSVFYICGAKWRDCLKISFVSSLISAVIALGISCAVIKYGIMEFSNDIGFRLDMNNIAATAVLVVIMTALAVIVPLFMLNTRQPKDILSSNQ